MGSVLHGSARTTPRIRAELQASQESSRALAARYSLDPKTVRKWRGRTTTADAPMGPKAPKSTVLTPAEEAIVVEFRRRTLLPLDDVLGCLMDTIPNLSRSALHRCLQRHGINIAIWESSQSQLFWRLVLHLQDPRPVRLGESLWRRSVRAGEHGQGVVA